jgi:hypothetical protein
MERQEVAGRVRDWLWFLFFAVGSSIWCVSAAHQLSATFDEPIYLQRGLQGWRDGSHRGLMQLGTMPLPVDLDTLPLYLWERWHGVPLDPVQDLDRLLPWARTGTLVFWWLLLLYGRAAGRQLAGPWGGRLAVALLACEPSFLAHASLATTDIAVSACLVAFVYHFRTGRTRGWGWRVGMPAAWFAATVLAKASGLLFGPLCLCAIELHRWLNDPGEEGEPDRRGFLWFLPAPARLRAFRRDCVQIGVLGIALVFLYCGSDWQAEPSFLQWAERLPEGAMRRSMVTLADHLCIFSNAGEGLIRQVKHNVRGHGTYLLGRVADRSIWYYFPVVLAIKLSLPLLLLPLGVAAVRPRALLNWACLAALGLLAFSLTYRVQIGIRLVLPVVALGVVGLGAALVQTCRELWEQQSIAPVRWRYALSVAAIAAILASVGWTSAAAVRVWPEGLCYTNELWGGTRRGFLVLSDSNYDWGQGLKELARWETRHGSAPVKVWYFGTDPAVNRPPLREVPLHRLPVQSPEDMRAQVRGSYLAVSTTLLYGSFGTLVRPGSAEETAYREAATFLRGLRPVARTTTFLIYDFRKEQ